MSAVPTIDPDIALMLAVFVLFGATLAGVYLVALAWNVRVLLHTRRLMPAVALPLLRFVIASAGLIFAAFEGADALLACLAGFLLARAMALSFAGTSS